MGLGELKSKGNKKADPFLDQPWGLWGLVFVKERPGELPLPTLPHPRQMAALRSIYERYDYPSIARITATNLQSLKYF
ncbi:hypothetical protein [Chryseolinea soli]|uniref:Uncharacterized protein n=1 Tax=Chryseolinea soli TaxID=2321403 RepID=A0A385SSY9_9BACT|nr:hypothetical protein [Chryseolinea soli]AYB33257.1 hypothetical protein D4L85_22915 [Chryseolinea soli]